MHAWLVVYGQIFDPLAFAFGWSAARYVVKPQVLDVVLTSEPEQVAWRADWLAQELGLSAGLDSGTK